MWGRVFRPGERTPTLIYPLVHELADDEIDVAVACRVLTVSRSGYYDTDSRETYGSLRAHADLTLRLGLQVKSQAGRPAHARRWGTRVFTGADVAAAPSVTPPRSPAATWSTASSPSRDPIGCGSPTSLSIPRIITSLASATKSAGQGRHPSDPGVSTLALDSGRCDRPGEFLGVGARRAVVVNSVQRAFSNRSMPSA